MLISNNYIYLELHKTGCTHTRDILYKVCQGNCIIIGKHNTYEQLPRKYRVLFNERIKIANIRNPWDWYVSLWSYGCQRKGGLYTRLTSKPGIRSYLRERLKGQLPKLDPKLWQQLYDNPNNINNFRLWLKYLLEVRGHSIGEDYKESFISTFAGLLTYRYIKLLTYNGTNKTKEIQSYKELENHDIDNNFIDIIIRNERINEDLLSNSKKLGFSPSNAAKVISEFNHRTNSSIRNKDYKVYYDKESINLIQEKERLIISKYNYMF